MKSGLYPPIGKEFFFVQAGGEGVTKRPLSPFSPALGFLGNHGSRRQMSVIP